MFLLTFEDKPEIHAVRLRFAFPKQKTKDEYHYLTTPRSFETQAGQIICGGEVETIRISPSGTRLIVSFKDKGKGSEYLQLFHVKVFGQEAVINRDMLMEM